MKQIFSFKSRFKVDERENRRNFEEVQKSFNDSEKTGKRRIEKKYKDLWIRINHNRSSWFFLLLDLDRNFAHGRSVDDIRS